MTGTDFNTVLPEVLLAIYAMAALLFAPLNAGAEHLRALAAVSRAMRSPELREHLRQARTIDAVRALFVKDVPASAA